MVAKIKDAREPRTCEPGFAPAAGALLAADQPADAPVDGFVPWPINSHQGHRAPGGL